MTQYLETNGILLPTTGPDKPDLPWPQSHDDYVLGMKCFKENMKDYGGILLPLEIQFGGLTDQERLGWTHYAKTGMWP